MNIGMQGRALRAGSWMSALMVVRQPVLLLRTFILARLLLPEDFGLVGVMLIVTGLVDGVSVLGLRSALMQRSDIFRRHLDTVWTVDIVRGVLSAILVFAIAPLAADFFGAADAVNLIRFAAIAPLIHGFTNIGTVRFERDLEYRKVIVIQGSQSLVDVVVSVAAAFMLHNAWALAFGLVAGTSVAVVLSFAVSAYRPRLFASVAVIRDLLQFSLWVSFSRLLRTLNGNLDFILVGRLIDVATLGLYQMSWRISFAVINAFNSMAIPQIAFVSYARIKDDRPRMRRAYRQMTELVLSFALPAAAALVVAAPILTTVLLGDRWEGAVVPMQILAVAAGVRAFRQQANSVAMGAGRSRTVFARDLFVTFILIVSLIVLVPRWGASGAAWAVLLSLVVSLPLYARDLRRILEIGLVDVVRPLVLPLIIAGGVAGAGVSSSLMLESETFIGLALLVVTMFVAFSVIVLASHKFFDRGPLSIIATRRVEQGPTG